MADVPTPPQNLDAEESVLGACMMSARAIDATADEVRPSDFYRESHGVIYQTILDLHASGSPVDAITVSDNLGERGQLERVGGQTRLHEIAALVPAASNARHYAKIVREMSALRNIIGAGEEILRLGRDRTGTTGEIMERVEQITFALARHRATGPEFLDAETVMVEALARMEALSHGGEIVGLPTGFTEIDRLTAGLHPGNLIVVAGRPSMGKSAFAFGVALNTAVQAGLPVAIFTFEMNKLEVAQRLISAESFVDASRVRSPSRMSTEDWKRVMDASARISGSPLLMDDTKTATMADVRSRCRRLKLQRPNLALVIIDYLQLMGSGRDRIESRQQDLTAISRDLKLMASELDIPVLVLSQLSRAVEGRHDKRPILSDLRECVAADQDVYDAITGRWVPVSELAPGSVSYGMTGTWNHHPSDVQEVWPTGVQEVLRLRTRTGRELRATANHPLLTIDGWVPLSGIVPGTRVAAPRSLPAPIDTESVYTDDEVRLLGYLTSDGGYIRHRSVSYTKDDPVLLADVERIARDRFGIVAGREHRGNGTYDLDLTAGRCGPRGNPLINWLRSVGVHGQYGYEKRVPPSLFSHDDRVVAVFLGSLWAGYGSIVRRKGRWVFKFTSTSRGLLVDVQRLLLRLGILSILGPPERHPKSTRDIATLHIQDRDAQIAFAERVPVPGRKGLIIAEALTDLRSRGRRNAHADRLPIEVTEVVADRARARGISWNDLGYRCQGKEMCRRDLGRVADRLGHQDLAALARSSVVWDEVVSVDPDGSAETFDFRAPTTGNIIVSGLYCHNSGAIEQDADVVMMIYRGEYYFPEDTELQGIAEIDIAKQRNGPTGMTKVAFVDRYARFSDLRPDLA